MGKIITRDHTKQAYRLAKDVHEEKLKLKTAKDKLEDAGMGRGSAGDYIVAFRRMMEGRRYTRTINEYSTRYYLKKIHTDFDKRVLIRALSSVERHVEYYEKLENGNLPSIRTIHREFSKKYIS